MEVHHPHHPSHKKKWSEYLLEFFMLFVAVTLGFFAENIREHFAEEQKANDLIETVAKDLKSDLDQLNMLKAFALEKSKICDSLKMVLNSNPNQVDQKDYYRNIMNFAPYYVFNPNDKSILDAESKGYFFREENKELASLIKSYNFWMKDYQQGDRLMAEQAKFFINDLLPQIADPELIYKIWRYPSPPLESKIGIMPIKPEAAKRTIIFLATTKGVMDGFASDIDTMSNYATKAIHLIEKNK